MTPHSAAEVTSPAAPANPAAIEGTELRRLVTVALDDPELAQGVAQVRLSVPNLVAVATARIGELSNVAVEQQGAVEVAAGRVTETQAELSSTRSADGLATLMLACICGVIAGLALTILGPTTVGVIGGGISIAVFLVAAVPYQRRTVEIRLREERFSEAELDLAAASVALAEARLETGIKPIIRDEINRRDGERWSTELGTVNATGLFEAFDARFLVPTDARAQLERSLAGGNGVSLGLSGPRGVGKSALIRALCPVSDEPRAAGGIVSVVVAAPVAFEARDFLLHLSAEICRSILGTTAVERLRRPDSMGSSRSRRPSTYGLLLAGVAVGLGDGLWVALPNSVGTGRGLAQLGLGVLALLSFASGYWHLVGDMWRARSSQNLHNDLRAQARSHLLDVWFQQSFTRGWSGQIQLPAGIQGGLEGGRELARNQLSVPDLVGDLRRLVERLVDTGSRLRVGIDELDKIDSPEDASRFLNEIKVLFGIRRCSFLVSVSEDALASFERRGMPLRDAFDSAFDDVVHVDYFTPARSVQLLEGRTIGLPIPFMLLAHAIAGGLPRDVIRIARELVALAPQTDVDPPRNLGVVLETVLLRQIAGKARATMTVAAQLPASDDLTRFQAVLYEASTHPSFATLAGLVRAWEDPRIGDQEDVIRLAREFSVFAYFVLTIGERFRQGEDENSTSGFGQWSATELGNIRQTLAIDPSLAQAGIDQLRRTTGLEILMPALRSNGGSTKPASALTRRFRARGRFS